MFSNVAFSEEVFAGLGIQSTDIAFDVSGVSATGNVGTLTATGTSNVIPTGAFGSTGLGNESIVTDVSFSPTGTSGGGQTGSVLLQVQQLLVLQQ